MNEIEQNIQKSENIQDPIYSELQKGLPSKNYKEINAVFNWDTGTKTMLGVDDNDISHLISEVPSEEINEIKQAVDNNQEVSQEMLEKIPSMLGGIKKWSMSSTKGDWYKSLEKAGLAFSDFLEQGSRLITGGQIRELFDDQARIFRKGNITLNVTNEEIKNGFLNMREDFQPGAENHPFNEDGNLKEGWQEISQSVASADAIQYENQEFSPAPMFEYILQYGLGGKKIYDVLGNVSKLKKAPIIKAVLAELGVEFAGATQKKDDVNLLNMLEGFGFGEESGTVLNILRESLAANDDDTALERKLKNAAGNAPVGLGLGLTIKTISKTKTLYNFMKKLKYNKEGRTELSKKLGYSIEKDNGINGDFKVQDKNGITIASFATKEEADELSKILGDGHEVQEIKSLGAAATSNKPITPAVAVDSSGQVIKQADELVTSEKPFYSNVEKTISNFKFKQQPGNQILATLNNTAGIKQSEIQDLGLDTFLKDNPSVTKEQLDDFIADNSLTTKVKDEILEGSQAANNKSDLFIPGDEKGMDIPEELLNANSYDDAKLIVKNNQEIYDELDEFYINDNISENEMLEDDFIETFLEERYGIYQLTPDKKPAMFESYVTPGGENYKEMLITVPGSPQVYTKHHYNGSVNAGENLIAHARFNDRIIDNKKILFIEEIQSDLHQTGRKEGYTSDAKKKIQNEINLREKELKEIYGDNYSEEIYYDDRMINILMQKRDNVFMLPNLVADAPFKKNWHELTMKRLIKYAVDNDYDGIALTSGDMQAARYPGQDNLKVFYDNTLVKFTNKFGKKYGAKIDKASIGKQDEGSVSFDVDATFNYQNTRLREAETIQDVYRITKENKYLQKEFQLYLRDDLNEATYANMSFDELQKELGSDIDSYINEWLINDFGLEIGVDSSNKVPMMLFTPNMKKEILTEGVPIAQVEDQQEKNTALV
jgi:hypothetical protein